MKSFQKYLTLVCSVCLIASCSKKSTSTTITQAASPFSTKNSLSVGETVLSNGGCLSVPLYAEAIHSLNPRLSVLQISTGFSIDGSNIPRESFSAQMAYSTFQFKKTKMPDIAEFNGFTQTDCKSLIYTAADDSTITYNITNATSGALTAEADTGEKLEYHFLSPQSVEVKSRYQVTDEPCSDGTAFVEITKVLDWSGVDVDSVDLQAAQLAIDKSYLQLVASAVGYNIEDLYTTAPAADPSLPGVPVLIASKLSELAAMPIKPEILACRAPDITIPPTPTTPPATPGTEPPPFDPSGG